MFTGVTLPFDVAEMLGGVMDLIGLLGPFIVLGLAVAFAPRIISVIRGAMGRGGSKS